MRHLCMGLVCTALVTVHSRASVVTIAWDASDPNVAGYRLHYGSASRVYSSAIDVGPGTSCALSNLIAGATYFFAVTAYNSLGESAFSEEIVYVPKLRIGDLAANEDGAILTWASPPGAVFRIFIAHSLNNPLWVDISGPIVALSSTTSFTHVRTSSDASVFYRLEMIRPPLSGAPPSP